MRAELRLNGYALLTALATSDVNEVSWLTSLRLSTVWWPGLQ